MARDEGKDGKRDAARGKDSGKDEDYEFVPPDFDEDAFIHREMVSFRTTTILFVWGIVAALVSWALFAAVDGRFIGWGIGLGIAAVFGLALKWIYPRLKADVKHFGRREWLGTAFLFFFTWLAFFIIAINPPVSDFAAPRVDLHAAPAVQQDGGDVVIEAFFEDNHRVADHAVTIHGPDGEVAFTDRDLGHGHHQLVATGLAAGLYRVEAEAQDTRGHHANASITFAVVEDAIAVEFPDGMTLDSAGDRVLVAVGGDLPPCTSKVRKDCIRTVHLDLAGGTSVVLEHNAQMDRWVAVPNHAGWAQGQVTFDAVAEVVDAYSGQTRVDGGHLTAGPYTINVTAATGDYVPKVVSDPGPRTRSVPGLEVPALVVALAALAFLARRR